MPLPMFDNSSPSSMMTRSATRNANENCGNITTTTAATTAPLPNGHDDDAGAVCANGSIGEHPTVLSEVTNTPTILRQAHRRERQDIGEKECLTTAATAAAVGFVRRESKKPKTEGSTPMTTDCSTITMTDSDSAPSASTSIITMSTPRSIVTSTSAQSLQIVESSKSCYYPDVSCVPPAFQLQRPGESMRERFECDEVSWDSSVVGDLLIRQELQLYFTTVLDKENIVDLLNKMNSLCENDHLLLEFVRSRNTMYNGGPSFCRHAYDTLSKIDCFKDLFASIENGGYKIGNVYNGAYGEDFGDGEGRIDLHQDASYKGTHRLIFPIGCINKELWFKKGKKVCGLRMHHGSVVCMSHRAGGVIGSVYHAASRCGKSWILVIEVSKKK